MRTCLECVAVRIPTGPKSITGALRLCERFVTFDGRLCAATETDQWAGHCVRAIWRRGGEAIIIVEIIPLWRHRQIARRRQTKLERQDARGRLEIGPGKCEE